MKSTTLRPYLTAFRIRALLETQYRGAALGGVITQAFFGVVLAYLYTALYAGGDPAGLRDTVTYVWLQQMFFRVLMTSDSELQNQIMTGSLAYTLCRPVDQHAYWVCRDLAAQWVGALMRMLPMIALQFLLPREVRMALPASPAAFLQFLLSLSLGVACVAQIHAVASAVTMKTLDSRGFSALINLLMMILAGNIIPLTLFPETVQALLRYQPFAQALDAPIRMYQHAQSTAEFSINLAAQLGWLAVLTAGGRALWRQHLRSVTVQGG